MMLGFHYMDYYHNAYAMNQYLAAGGMSCCRSTIEPASCMAGTSRAGDGGPRAGGVQGHCGSRPIFAGLPNVDPKKIGVGADPMAGYLTAMGLAHNSDLFAAGVDLHGVHDWSAFGEEFPRSAGPGCGA